MDVSDAIQARRSIRRYEKKKIPADEMRVLLNAARLAPSANNAQRWKIVIVTDDDTKQRLVPVSGNQEFVGECSAYLVGVAERDNYSSIDLAIALDHLSLRAVELGLGTCWVGDFEPDGVKRILGIPEEMDVPICMTLGYPASVPHARGRKSLSELFHKDKWAGPLD
ncbi:MAG: nitroreductase family protein [Thermoplasmata archaeon]